MTHWPFKSCGGGGERLTLPGVFLAVEIDGEVVGVEVDDGGFLCEEEAS